MFHSVKFKFYVYIPILLIPMLLCACEQQTQLNTKEIVREVKSREIKRVTSTEIMEEVNSEGAQVVASIQKNWLEALEFGMENKGKEYSKKFCIVPFIPGFDTIADQNTTIKKIGLSSVSQPRKVDNIEKQLLEAYQYNVENGIALKANTQKSGDTYMLYTSPIFANEKMCLECHSNNQGYADFKQGGFAGMWSVKILKKSVIQKID